MRPARIASLLLTLTFFPLAAMAGDSNATSIHSLRNYRVSTGVTEPSILHFKQVIPEPSQPAVVDFPSTAKLVLRLHLNKRGKAKDVHIIKSDDPYLDTQVLAAVRHFDWSPARLDQHRIPVAVNLVVFVRQ